MHIYEKLFEDPLVIPLLNKIAPRLFVRIRIALGDAIYLAMARVTDPSESETSEGLRKNISVARIQADLKSEGYPCKRVNRAATDLCSTAKSIRLYRSRRIAHLDDKTVRGEVSLSPEGGFPLQEYIEQSQKFLDSVMVSIGSIERYTIQHENYPRHADAFLHSMRYVDANWDDLEQIVRSSNLDSGLKKFFSQTIFK